MTKEKTPAEEIAEWLRRENKRSHEQPEEWKRSWEKKPPVKRRNAKDKRSG